MTKKPFLNILDILAPELKKKNLTKKLKNNEFRCDNCFKVYTKEWSDKESKAEAEYYFGKPVDEWQCGFVVICDDCFKQMHPEKNPALVEEAKKTL